MHPLFYQETHGNIVNGLIELLIHSMAEMPIVKQVEYVALNFCLDKYALLEKDHFIASTMVKSL